MSDHRRKPPARAAAAGGTASGWRRWWDGPPGTTRQWPRRLGILAVLGFLFSLFIAGVVYAAVDIPDPKESAVKQASIVYYAGGEEEISRFGDTTRISVPIDRVPRHVQDAVIAAENRDFYTDNGVSPKGILRAFLVNLRGGATQGGSTITQQYVKNSRLTAERSIVRKLKEAVIAIKIDKQMSKQEILEAYLNTIYFGRSAEGIQAAAKAYFGKDIDEISLEEGAALAAILRSPGNYDPETSGDRLRARWQFIINTMAETGAIGAEQAANATFPTFMKKDGKSGGRNAGQKGYILDAVAKELTRRGIDEAVLKDGGLRIETTLVKKSQEAAVDAVEEEAPDAEGLRIGLSAVEPGTGKIVAMYGGKDYLSDEPHAQENNALAEVQPGSAVKPLTAVAALEEGLGLTTRLDGNSPKEVPGGKDVENQGDRDYGRVNMVTAMERSINTAFVDLVLQVGARNVADVMERAGFPQVPNNLVNAGLTLGIHNVSTVQLAGAYATLAAEGLTAQPHIIESVVAGNGGELPLEPIKPKRVFERDVVSDVTFAMQAVVKGKNGTGTRARALGRPAAAKTGTHEGANGILKVWFSGFTPQLAASVTIFKGDANESLRGISGFDSLTGGKYPALIWTAFMKAALEGEPIERFPKPAGLHGGIPTAPPSPSPVAPTFSPTPSPAFTLPNGKTRTPRGCFPFCPQESPSESPSPVPTFSEQPAPGPGNGHGGGGGNN